MYVLLWTAINSFTLSHLEAAEYNHSLICWSLYLHWSRPRLSAMLKDASACSFTLPIQGLRFISFTTNLQWSHNNLQLLVWISRSFSRRTQCFDKLFCIFLFILYHLGWRQHRYFNHGAEQPRASRVPEVLLLPKNPDSSADHGTHFSITGFMLWYKMYDFLSVSYCLRWIKSICSLIQNAFVRSLWPPKTRLSVSRIFYFFISPAAVYGSDEGRWQTGH